MAKKPAKKAKTGTAVAVHKPQQPLTFLQTMRELATDPHAEASKVQAFLEMRDRQEDRAARLEFDAQMADLQPALPTIKKTGEIIIREKGTDKIIQRTKHAKWEVIHKVITPILHQYGFALRHHVGQSADGRVTITAILSHRAGHRDETTITLPYDTTGSKNNVQAIGSSISYGKRYTAAAILNLNFEGEDDDGMAGGGTAAIDIASNGVISEAQAHEISLWMTETKSKTDLFLSMLSEIGKVKIAKVSDIPASLYETAMAKLKLKKERLAQPAQ